jgi:hypothetical protein
VNNELLKKVLSDEESYATTLLIALLDKYGTGLFDWEPATLDLEAEHVLAMKEIPQENKDKIWALITVLTTNTFYTVADAFTHVCNALSGSGADFQNWDILTPDEVLWGMTEVALIDPPSEEEPHDWSEEVRYYIGNIFDMHGFSRLPKLVKSVALLDVDSSDPSSATCHSRFAPSVASAPHL